MFPARNPGSIQSLLFGNPYNQGNPEDIESIEFYLNLDEGSGNVQIKNLIVSAGTNETDWVPAPEDQEYLVTQAQAEFERTAQGLKAKLDTISTNFNPDGTTSEKILTAFGN